MAFDRTSNDPAEIFGSFFLNSSEFAVAVKNISEVVNAPETLVAMPLAPPFLLGIFNLRGAIIPVIDLKVILKLERPDQPLKTRKIAIVEYTGVKVGLLFDGTGQIFRNQNDEKSDFQYEDGHESHVISGAIKLDGGQRIVQVLDATALVKLEQVPHAASAQSAHAARAQRSASRGARRQCISFACGETRLALGIESIHEIVKAAHVKPSVLGAGLCLGMLELRGDVVPVVDLAALLKYREPTTREAITGDQRIIIVKLGTDKVGLLIDSVESIVTYYADDLLYLPVLAQEKAALFAGCIAKDGEGEIILLKSEEILSHAELGEITQGHSKLYHAKTRGEQKAKSKGALKSYITFKLDNLFALEMAEVRELIEYPKQVIRPPGLAKSIRGMLNLRGQMIAVLDVRTLYQMDGATDVSTAKILVFEKGGVSHGLIVDSVESIVSFSEADHMKMPEVLYKSNALSGIANDVKFAVELTIGADKACLLVLNLDPLIARAGVETSARVS